MWWMIPSIAISIIPQWCGGESFSLPSRPTAIARRWRRGSGANSKSQFGPEYGEWLEQLGTIRQQLFASKMNPEERRQLLHELASREAFEKARSEGFR